ncbi:MAG: STAS domain-containing protein [Phycisphaeraceae bacterium]|nr:STAS domain-containing protein [Phycisphaeraceae bacterium]
MADLQIEEETRGDTVIVRFIGSADLESEADLHRAIVRLSAGHPRLLVADLSKLKFLASLAMGEFVALMSSIKQHGGKLVVAAPHPTIAEALKRARLYEPLNCVESVEIALTMAPSA